MKNKMKKWIFLPLAAPALLLIPLVAMRTGGEMMWSAFDFLVAGILLFLTGAGITLILVKIEKPKYKLLWIALVLLILFLVWAELAVGIFGTPVSGS